MFLRCSCLNPNCSLNHWPIGISLICKNKFRFSSIITCAIPLNDNCLVAPWGLSSNFLELPLFMRRTTLISQNRFRMPALFCIFAPPFQIIATMAKYLDPKADLTFKKIFGEHPKCSKAYVRQLKKSKKDHLLQPVYSLSLVNDVFEPDINDFYHYYRLVHEEHTEKIFDGLHLVFVELPKFKPHTISEKKMQVLWIRFLTEIGEDTKEVPAALIE